MTQGNGNMTHRFFSIGWVFLVGLLVHTAAPHSAHAADILVQADRALKASNFGRAERHYRTALNGARKPGRRIRALHGLAGVLIRTRRLDEAERLVKRAASMIRRRYGADALPMARNRRLYAFVRVYKYRDMRGARAAIKEASRIKNKRLKVWRFDGKAYRHTPSGAKFPVGWAGLRLVERTIYDNKGLNVSGNYQARDKTGRILLTFYIYPNRGASLQQHFRQGIETVLRTRRGASKTGAWRITVNRRTGLAAGFLLAGGRARSHLFLFRTPRWFVKIRYTQPAKRLTDNATILMMQLRLATHGKLTSDY